VSDRERDRQRDKAKMDSPLCESVLFPASYIQRKDKKDEDFFCSKKIAIKNTDM
jgi:hypothetical protein